MDFRLKHLFNFDSALTGVITAAEMKVAVATSVATSAMVVGGGTVEQTTKTTVKMQLAVEQVHSAPETPSVAVKVALPSAASDSDNIGFSAESEMIDVGIAANFKRAQQVARINPQNFSEASQSNSVRNITRSGKGTVPFTKGKSSTANRRSQSRNSNRGRIGNRSEARAPASRPSVRPSQPAAPAPAVPSTPSVTPTAPTPANPVADVTPTLPTPNPESPVSNNNGGGSSAPAKVVTPEAPLLIAASGPSVVDQGSVYSLSAAPTYTGGKAGATISWSLDSTNTCSWIGMDSTTAAISGTPTDENVGVCTFAFRASDGSSFSNLVSFSITVQNVNATLSIADASPIDENAAQTTIRTNADVQASEEGFGTYSLIAATAPDCRDNELFSGINTNTGRIDYQPANGYSGTCNFKVQFDDGNGGIVSDEFSILVNPNVVPTLTIADAATILEDAATTTVRTNADVQASEEGSGTYSLIAATAPDCRNNEIFSGINTNTGRVDYQPAANYNGTCNFNVQFDDGNGGIVSDEFAVTVTPVNDAPVIAATCPASINQNVAYACSVNPAATDLDTGDTHTWALNGTNTCAWAAINATTGVVSGTPTDDDVGACTLAIRAHDGTVSSNILNIAVTVNNVAPTLTIADAAAILEGVAQTTIRANADVQASEEGFGTYSLIAATAPDCRDNQIFSGINTNTGRMDFQPAVNFNGTCNFNVQFDDGNGGIVSDEFAITVTAASPTLDLSFTNCGSFPS